MNGWIAKTKELILNILFPPICLNCRENVPGGEIICGRCLAGVEIYTALYCPFCFKRNGRCHPETFYLLGAACSYDEPAVKSLVTALKYRSFEKAAVPLSVLIVKFLETAGLNLNGWLLVPVPLGKNRLRKRGFNQAEAIGAEISLATAAPLLTGVLARIKNTKPQTDLKNKEERRENVAGCFLIKNPEAVKNKNVVLIDDVFTSGATMNEAVKALKAAGAKKIIALTAARA